ncbi:similar to Kazachstania africana KAFR_0I01780 hypothetical protein [Maudiozyma saulgeensis]|uniref:Hyphally-regulated cell wall protein N-terminal domain-containing protein n=1 Tax=Maudiozyma saulgeensis TaxID=1789683 RepID=A0A1X7R0F4_9SACH|nr:similar to Kazachstania africana KAFR_0I01780 hypothetical protein [Kazachstania saulgeensis]
MVNTKTALFTAACVLSMLSSVTLAQTFNGNQVLHGLTYFILPVSVTSGSNLIIQSGLFHKFWQKVTVRGGLYICETKSSNIGMTVMALANIMNYGTFVVDDSLASTGLLFESFGLEFFNSGDFYLVGKKPFIIGSHYRIWALNFHNSGLMAFYQTGTSNHWSTVELGPDTLFDLLHVTNTGTICLKSVNLHARVAFDGETGCVDVGAYATLTINHLISRSFKSQTIYMSDETSVVYVKSLLGLTSLTIRGFGGTNRIYFRLTVTYYTYNNVSGILTVIDGLNLFRIDIGPNYEFDQFYRVTSHLLIGSGITYIPDSPDSSRPENCRECTPNPTCEDALNGKSSVTTASNTFTNTELPDPYTTTYTDATTTETQLISFYWTTDINGSSFIVETVYTLTGEAASSSIDGESKSSSASATESSSVDASSEVSSASSTASSDASSSSSTASSSSSTASSDASTVSSSSSGSLSYYTTTKSDATTTETLVISDYTTTDNNGNTVTMESTYTITASQAPLTTYTTTVVVDGTTSVYVVCDYTTTDANGNTVTLVSSYPCITEGTATTYTRTITAEICTSTVVVCTCTSTKSNGETVSTLTTYPATYTPTDMSGNSYTTTVVVGGTVTEVVECDYLTTDSNGNTYTARSTVTETSLTTATETAAKNAADTKSTTTVTNTSVATKTAPAVVISPSSANNAQGASHTVATFQGSGSIVKGSLMSLISAFLFLMI